MTYAKPVNTETKRRCYCQGCSPIVGGILVRLPDRVRIPLVRWLCSRER